MKEEERRAINVKTWRTIATFKFKDLSNKPNDHVKQPTSSPTQSASKCTLQSLSQIKLHIQEP